MTLISAVLLQYDPNNSNEYQLDDCDYTPFFLNNINGHNNYNVDYNGSRFCDVNDNKCNIF